MSLLGRSRSPRHRLRPIVAIAASATIALAGCSSDADSPASPASSSESPSPADGPAATSPATAPESTTAATAATAATIAPDARLVFQADGRIQTVLPDGSDLMVVTSEVPEGQEHPDWSPGGDQLVFETQFAELWTVGDDGSDPTSVYRCEAPCVSLQDGAWSPDGTEIAFMVAETEDDNTTSRSAILAVDVATGEVRTIYEDTSGRVWLFNPRWSGDGESIVFEEDTFASNLLSESEITSMAVATVPADGDGTATTLVTFDGPSSGPGAPAPDWSPIDDRIAFVRGDNLFTIGADGANETQLTDFDGAQEHAIQPTFTPDGRAIVFTYVTGEFGVDDVPRAAVISLDRSRQTTIGDGRSMTHVRLQP